MKILVGSSKDKELTVDDIEVGEVFTLRSTGGRTYLKASNGYVLDLVNFKVKPISGIRGHVVHEKIDSVLILGKAENKTFYNHKEAIDYISEKENEDDSYCELVSFGNGINILNFTKNF